ncbi:MAG TPA: HIT domain-containing protein [Stellaceae bacterium]|nr:HIT domain-containing protein [Stellaceae bacterium]
MTDRPAARAFFCVPAPDRVLAANEFAFAVRDTSPVTALHTLILPRRHVGDYFDLVPAEDSAIRSLLTKIRSDIMASDAHVKGFNIGETAGQTIFHCHAHLIPRADSGRSRRAMARCFS